MKSAAATPAQYLAELPADRKRALSAVRKTIRANLPKGYVETMNWGMICYQVPLSVCANTYNSKPLMYAALASQKNHLAVYFCAFNCVDGALAAFRKDWKAGKIDMGVACLRFRSLTEIDLEAIGRAIGAIPVSRFVAASQR